MVVGAPVGASVVGAAAHAAASMVLTAFCSDVNELTLNTLAEDPAISASSPELMPLPTPTARMVVCGTSRMSAAAVRVADRLMDRPSVKTTTIRGTVADPRIPL
jgi:hypothetical protein